jgi:hypothetical protein
MVTVSIFTLRDVIRRVQMDYKIPHNGISHTSPIAETDLHELCNYLKLHKLQMYHPTRENNEFATPARDLMVSGMEYANTAGAFKNFNNDTRRVKNNGKPCGTSIETVVEAGSSREDNGDEGDKGVDFDLGGDLDIRIDDLAMDEEEFPQQTDLADFVAMTRDVIDELDDAFVN